jgi:NTE family protein
MPNKKKIGIALSGGVGYCMAHIGVFQALEAAGIKPDMMSGTSGGALIGALYASGIKPDRLEVIAKSIKWPKLMGMTMIFKGLASSKPIETLVADLLGKDRRFADLSIPLLVTAVDLISEEIVIFPDDPAQTVALPVRASCSLPMVYSPVKYKDMLLVDGGMLVQLPVAELKQKGMDAVIAVAFQRNRTVPSSIFDVTLRTLSIANRDRLEESRRTADILIECNVGQASRWDLQASSDLIRVGRLAAEDAIAKNSAFIKQLTGDAPVV